MNREHVAALLGPTARVVRRALTGEHGIALPPLTDHHVHSHLVDVAALPRGGVAAVLDLGGDPLALFRAGRSGMPHREYAGAFITAPGGYPVARDWAPPESVREVIGSLGAGVAGSAETAVDEQVEFGASVIKVALHADAGPVFDTATLRAIVVRAHSRGLPVVAHVQGAGMPRLALVTGVDVLAHTPFTETLDGGLVAAAILAGQAWISTLSIHDDAGTAHAVANLARFAGAGGRVLYGTDLGNGVQPLGVNPREVAFLGEAGVRGAALVAALTDPLPRPAPVHGVATFVPGGAPEGEDDVAEWLTAATVVPEEELVDDGH
ncbi:hypothetical protein [Microbacterium sp. CJ88]|uniref:hypothetical protein n=1 Tax=Microbacterium sp. CJ88 TaxID=3445672 RepID=UPI003F65F74E